MTPGQIRILGVVAIVALFSAACTGSAGLGNGTSTTVAGIIESSTLPVPAECGVDLETTPWTEEVSVQAEVVSAAAGADAGVALALYPRPDYEGKPWSAWGQGIAVDDGRFFSSIGDHQGADGNSFVYEYDPDSMTLTQIVDVLSVVSHVPGDWGFGKIHAQMVAGPCGDIFFSTYWGSRRGLTFNDGYQGDLLLRLDPEARSVGNLGLILPEHGVASMAATPDGSLIYAEAADPFGEKTGSFVVIDAVTGETVFEDPNPAHGGYRNIAVGPDGSAYITWNETGLARYDPTANTLTEIGTQLPGGVLRASTVPDASGRVYAVSRDPAVFFSLDPDGAVTELGAALGYTTTIALSRDGSRFYYVPDAHGGSWEQGTPLIAVDTETGESETVVELNPLVEARYGLRAGGTYSVAVSADGGTIYVVLNAGDPATRDSFGEVVLAIVTLP
ncbi:MAG: hypothetical protein OEM39_04510 [Acidimicrobiia bacterium]|nr:hypothetical protein [Acidimicrobiia bacterium]